MRQREDVRLRCRACGVAARSSARFCDRCGARLEQAPAAPARRALASPEVERGDRRVVTALFADLVDYVRLVAEHDPEEVGRRVDGALVAMAQAIEAFEGTREKFIGDAVFAVFGWPRGHDDDALRAVQCALAIRAALASAADGPDAEPLQVRIGLATGEVVAAPRGLEGGHDWSLTGPAVTTAARIQALAQPGEILLDDATRRAARKDLAVEDLGMTTLRGQSRPIRLVRLLGDTGFQPWRPPVGRLIGRRPERARLAGLLDKGTAGPGGALVVEGEAGIGKSRLMADLEQEARAAGWAWTWVDNVSYGAREPYRFARALAQSLADEHGTDSGSFARQLLFTGDVPAEAARRWAGAVAAIARDASFAGWEAEAPLAPAEPAAVAAAMRSVAVRYTERLIEVSGPRVIVADDLHWLDPSSAVVVDELIRLSARLPLIVLLGTRPGPTPAWATIGQLEGVERIVLGGLDEAETAELASSVAGAAVDPSHARRLRERTAGNPLFIGETIRALLDDVVAGAGRLDLDAGPAAPSVPITLRALLGSRIDALSEEARTVLRVASVVGVAFRQPVVAEVLGTEVGAAVYERLAEASLIRSLDGDGAWQFCHPLIHDVAYAGLLGANRRALHGRVADRLEANARPVAIGAVARHRAAAGDVERAVPLLDAAAEESLAIGALPEAAAFWTAAADLVGAGPAAEAYRRRARATSPGAPEAGPVAG